MSARLGNRIKSGFWSARMDSSCSLTHLRWTLLNFFAFPLSNLDKPLWRNGIASMPAVGHIDIGEIPPPTHHLLHRPADGNSAVVIMWLKTQCFHSHASPPNPTNICSILHEPGHGSV